MKDLTEEIIFEVGLDGCVRVQQEHLEEGAKAKRLSTKTQSVSRHIFSDRLT